MIHILQPTLKKNLTLESLLWKSSLFLRLQKLILGIIREEDDGKRLFSKTDIGFLIYYEENDILVLTLARTGTHSDLF